MTMPDFVRYENRKINEHDDNLYTVCFPIINRR